MTRTLWLFVVISLMLPVIFIGCDTEKTDSDWVNELRDRRTRDNAVLYVQEHRVKAAVPQLVSLMQKRYGTLKAIYSLGVIGDPVAVQPLLEELDKVATKDSQDHDRMTEQICMALGMIGASQAVDKLITIIKNPQAGEMGKSGAVQALGMIGDPRATEGLVGILKDEKTKLTIRHYAAIALGRIKAKEATDDLAFALFVDDKSGRNLFRDGQLSLLQIGGDEVKNSLIKAYELKNEDIMTLAKTIDLKEPWIKIKAVNVMGQMRDANNSDFLFGEFEKGLQNKIAFEVYAKVIQAMALTPLKKEHLNKIADEFVRKVLSTDFLNEREIMKVVMINNSYTDRLEDIMKVAEGGDITLKSVKGKPAKFSQWCFAAADLVSTLGDHTFSDRFAKLVADGKCSQKIYGLKMKTSEMLAKFNERMQASKKCGTDMACWQKMTQSPKWPEREKAIYVLANTGDKKYMKDIIKTLKFPNEMVRRACSYAISKLMSPEELPTIIRFWQDQKINKEFQKVTEDIGYIIYLRLREWNLDSRDKVKEIFDKAEKLRSAGKRAKAVGDKMAG